MVDGGSDSTFDATTYDANACLESGVCHVCDSCSAAPNATGRCVGNQCTLACSAGFFDCDRRYETGCETSQSPEHCGNCDTRCSAPANATALCTNALCTFACNPGFVMNAGQCIAFATRPLHPWSGWLAASQTIEFKWLLAPTATSTRLEICRERSCANIEFAQEFATPIARYLSPRLTPGVHFWRVTATGPAGLRHQSNVWQVWVPVTHRTPFMGVDRPVVDLNGDGWQDIVLCDTRCAWISNPYGGATPGVLTRFSGLGVARRDQGMSPESAGDLNGDGFGDLMVSVFAEPADSPRRTHILMGSSSPPNIPSLAFEGLYWRSNRVAASSSDINADGYSDVIEITADRRFAWRPGGGSIETLSELRGIETSNDVDAGISIFQCSTASIGTEFFMTSPTLRENTLWELNLAEAPTVVSQRWDARSTQILTMPRPLRPHTVLPMGDLNGDGVPEALFARLYIVPAPAAVVLASGERDPMGTISFRALSDSLLEIPNDTRVVAVVSPLDLDANGQPEFAIIAQGYIGNMRTYHDLYVGTGDFHQPNTLRALALNAGRRECIPSNCSFDWAGSRAIVPVGGDFDKDGYDDLIVPDIDRSRLMILRGGPVIDNLRWEPLPINVPRDVVGILVS